MEVRCPQCQTKQQVSTEEASRFWAICKECGVIHGPATAKAMEGMPLSAAPTHVGNQFEDATEWVPADGMFDDILALVDEETEGHWQDKQPSREIGEDFVLITEDIILPAHECDSPDTQLAQPEVVFDTVVACPEESPEQTALEAPNETDSEDEGGVHPTDEAQDVIHFSQPPEGRSESDIEEAPPVIIKEHVPVPDGYAVGARVLRIAPVWLLLSCVGFVGLLILLSWVSKPAGEVGAEAVTLERGGLKTEATNQSPAQAPSELANSVNSALKSVETAPAEEHSAKAQTAEEAETVAAAPLAQGQEADEGGGNFTAQVGSYSNVSGANERVSALRAAGFEARAVEVEVQGRGVWYRVQCGRFATREEAARFGAQLRAKGVAREVIIAEVQKQ
jgi:cell division septation protein DedD